MVNKNGLKHRQSHCVTDSRAVTVQNRAFGAEALSDGQAATKPDVFFLSDNAV